LVPCSNCMTITRPTFVSLAKGRVAIPAVLTALTFAGPSRGQSDIDRPLPNVLLVIDSSGSMEFRAADNALPVCHPGQPGLTNERSRWIDLVEIMTGTVSNYSCLPMSRSTTAFSNEYGISGTAPYDWNYINPFNRIVSGSCTVGPGVLPSTSNPYEFPTNGIYRLPVSGTTVTRPTSAAQYTSGNATFGPCISSTGFTQANDGIMDVFKEKVRFGLMTFDPHTNSGTGVSGGNMSVATGFAGTWSYYLNNTPATGRPAECTTPATAQEVGARNAAAPPWEGRMVGFGASQSTSSDLLQRNTRIQEVLLATRPYGATPLAGQLKDARDFLWYDTSNDPLDSTLPYDKFGPKDDPLTMLPECRRSLIILLSDGEPNLDLRPDCVAADGGVANCPYQTPVQIASSLLNNPPDPDQSVETVVIGYAMPNVTPAGKSSMSCASLTSADCANNPNNRTLQACCTLNDIAAAGGPANSDGTPKTAYFPKTHKELKRTISRVLSNITTSVTTRTSAVFASASGSGGSGSYQFGAGFEPVPERPWHGKLTRTRVTCNNDGEPEEQAIDYDEGDNFAANVNSGSGPAREFITYLPTVAANASRSIRPYLSSNSDGLGVPAGAIAGPLTVDSFISQVPATTMGLTASSCDANNATTCRNDILGWLLGKTNSESETRCATPGDEDCSVFGAIFYASPAYVSGSAREYLQDETYATFARQRGVTQRSSVLYAPTVDGMLHAMKTAPYSGTTGAVNSPQNNELWAFLPPAVLPLIQTQYPNTPAVLLDGTPVVRDVPAYTSGGVTKLERRLADGKVAAGTFRTVLTAGFGVGQTGGGFYALDVTDPDLDDGGPKFLWQLTKDATGNALFGDGGTPVITTVFLKSGTSDPGSDVAVAILPGGSAGSQSGTTTSIGPTLTPVDTTYNAATTVNAYSGADVARSLTIVRLDNGEVLRSFRAVAPAALSASRTTVMNIPAPITGRPAAFPGAVGTNADRAYVGDAEGRLWRLDMSSADTSKWTFQVFFDLYYNKALGARQPVELAPVVSVDDEARVSLAVASGGQRVQTATPGLLNRIVSLSESFNKTTKKFAAEVNWIQDLGCSGACGSSQYEGERVTGPMEMFSGTLYFSSGIPASASSNQCTLANHRIWAVDYLKSEDERKGVAVPSPMSGPAGKWPTASAADVPPKSTSPEAGLVFGVAIEQQPTCAVDVEEPSDDPYLSYGNYTSTSSVSPGGFFLVYQVGGLTGNTSGNVTTNKVQLESPPSTVNIDSWAAVFE
jgi:type IV pilus assembly protein PilY1